MSLSWARKKDERILFFLSLWTPPLSLGLSLCFHYSLGSESNSKFLQSSSFLQASQSIYKLLFRVLRLCRISLELSIAGTKAEGACVLLQTCWLTVGIFDIYFIWRFQNNLFASPSTLPCSHLLLKKHLFSINLRSSLWTALDLPRDEPAALKVELGRISHTSLPVNFAHFLPSWDQEREGNRFCCLCLFGFGPCSTWAFYHLFFSPPN